MTNSESIYAPGDLVPVSLLGRPSCSSIKTVIGPGLALADDATATVIATKAGTLVKSGARSVHYLSSGQTRYTVAHNDLVVGTVVSKTSETFKVDIGTAEHVLVSALAFEGATKRMKPDVAIGDLLLCKLVVPNKDMEPEGVCCDGENVSRGMGVLPTGGHVTRVPLDVALDLRRQGSSPLRDAIMRTFKCEMTVGMNGWIHVRAAVDRDVIAVVDLLQTVAACSSQSERDELLLSSQTFAQQL